MFKIDFVRAYDCLDWIFLRNKLKTMGFGLRWMKSTIFTSTMSIMIIVVLLLKLLSQEGSDRVTLCPLSSLPLLLMGLLA